MKTISCTYFKSSGLHISFQRIATIEIADKPFDSGAFGEVYYCDSVNQTMLPIKQVVKIFIDDGSGSSIRGYNTIRKLQEKIIEHNKPAEASTPIRDMNALYALPQFSFEGKLNGRTVRGYAANLLSRGEWLLFSHIFNEENLSKRKLLRTRFYSLPLERRLNMARDLVEAFSQLEEMKFIYADLNPKNFFVHQGSGHLCLIDYEGGAINENPEIFGKPGEWLAPEIQQQLVKNNSQFIKVDLNTDTWAVAVAIHFMVFNFHPLFYLNVRGLKELEDYFRENQWPDIKKQHPNFRREISVQYDRYIQKLNSEIPGKLANAFAETINNGMLNSNRRLSYKQWLPILDALAKQDIPSVNVESSKTATIQSLSAHSPSVHPTQPGQGIAHASPQAAIVSHSTRPILSGRHTRTYVAAALTIVLTLGAYVWKMTPSDDRTENPIIKKTVTEIAHIQPTYLRFQDAGLNDVSLQNGRISSKVFSYLQPVVRVTEIVQKPQLTTYVKITAPNGKTFNLPGSTHVIDEEGRQEELALKITTFGCPKCPLGIYKVQIYADLVVIGMHSFEVY